MTAPTLTNLAVSIVVSDPWEFGSECGTGPFFGTITDASADTLIVRLAKPIAYRGRTFPTGIAKPRHVGDQPASVSFKPLFANIILLPLDVSVIAEITPDTTKEGVFVIGTVERR
jgi:hypothetical protein